MLSSSEMEWLRGRCKTRCLARSSSISSPLISQVVPLPRTKGSSLLRWGEPPQMYREHSPIS